MRENGVEVPPPSSDVEVDITNPRENVITSDESKTSENVHTDDPPPQKPLTSSQDCNTEEHGGISMPPLSDVEPHQINRDTMNPISSSKLPPLTNIETTFSSPVCLNNNNNNNNSHNRSPVEFDISNETNNQSSQFQNQKDQDYTSTTDSSNTIPFNDPASNTEQSVGQHAVTDEDCAATTSNNGDANDRSMIISSEGDGGGDHLPNNHYNSSDQQTPSSSFPPTPLPLPSTEQISEEDKMVEKFWKTYDAVIILSLGAQLGVLARLAASQFFHHVSGAVFREDSALFTNLPLNCLSCFLMGLFCSGEDALEVVHTRTNNHKSHNGDGPPTQKEAEDEMREVALDALERRIRASPSLFLFPAGREHEDLVENFVPVHHHHHSLEGVDDNEELGSSGLRRRGYKKKMRIRSIEEEGEEDFVNPSSSVQTDYDRKNGNPNAPSPDSFLHDEVEEAQISQPNFENNVNNTNAMKQRRVLVRTGSSHDVYKSRQKIRRGKHKLKHSPLAQDDDIDVENQMNFVDHNKNIENEENMKNETFVTSKSSALTQKQTNDDGNMLSPTSVELFPDKQQTFEKDKTTVQNKYDDYDDDGTCATNSEDTNSNQSEEDLLDHMRHLARLRIAEGWDVGTTAKAMSDDILLGLRIGFCGAISTFSSWNSAMVNLLRNGQIGMATVGYIIGLALPIIAYRAGQHVAVYIFIWKCHRETAKDEIRGYGLRLDNVDAADCQHEVATHIGSRILNENATEREYPSIRAILTASAILSITFLLCFLLAFQDTVGNQQFAISLLFTPFGVLARWKLCKKMNKIRYDFPLGTFTCNILACALSGSFGRLLAGNPGPEESVVLLSVVSGFAGSLSTLAAFVTEVLDMIDPIIFKYDGISYAFVTIIWGIMVGFVSYQGKDWADKIEQEL